MKQTWILCEYAGQLLKNVAAMRVSERWERAARRNAGSTALQRLMIVFSNSLKYLWSGDIV